MLVQRDGASPRYVLTAASLSPALHFKLYVSSPKMVAPWDSIGPKVAGSIVSIPVAARGIHLHVTL
jgi:hypothetical protein